MAPKKVATPALTRAEQLLLLVAARIDTGIRYLDANPGADKEYLRRKLDEEMVSFTKINNNELLNLRHNRKMCGPSMGSSPSPRTLATGSTLPSLSLG